MPVSDEGSYFSRFTLKFVEITAAGVATAVSGYLIAHVGGLLSAASVPAVIPATLEAVLPTATTRPTTRQIAPGVTVVPGSVQAQPVTADAGERRAAPVRDISAAPIQIERSTASSAQVPLRKTVTPEASASDSKPRDADTDMESVEAKVRAALAKADAKADTKADTKADANRPAVAPPRTADAAPVSTQHAPLQQTPVQQAPIQQATIQPAPLGTVEIQSRPVAGDAAISSLPARDPALQDGAPQHNVQSADAQNGVTQFFAAFKKIPEMLRNDAPVPADDAPRPPMPVGQ